METTKTTQCPECRAYNSHSPKCSLIDLETAKKQLVQYYDIYLTQNKIIYDKDVARQQRYNTWAKNLRNELTRWQGKFLVVTHENNKLRKKIKQNE